MDKYLRLTTWDGGRAFVYYDSITTIVEGQTTLLYISTDVILRVKESPEEIFRMMEGIEKAIEDEGSN